MTGRLNWEAALWLARRRTPNDNLRFWATLGAATIASSLLCLATSFATQGWEQVESSIGVIADGGTRGGAAVAAVLVALPALYLTGQSWQLGSVERRERLTQLRDAGAGPDDLRRVAVADTAVPSTIGSALGVLLLGALIGALNLRRTYAPLFRETSTGGVEPTGGHQWVPIRGSSDIPVGA